MKQTDITYGQLDKVLRGLGFTCRLDDSPPPQRVYEHQTSGARIMTPSFPETELVYMHHLVAARYIVDQFGVADAEVFDKKLRRRTTKAT